MQSYVTQWLPLTLLVLGLGFAIIRPANLLFRLNINGYVFLSQIKKLIGANNVDRAIKLCNVIPNTAVARATMSILEAYKNGVRDAEMLREIVDADLGDLDKDLRSPVWTIPLALILSGAGFFFDMSSAIPVDITHYALLSGSVVAVFIGFKQAKSIRLKTAVVKKELVNLLSEQEESSSS